MNESFIKTTLICYRNCVNSLSANDPPRIMTRNGAPYLNDFFFERIWNLRIKLISERAKLILVGLEKKALSNILQVEKKALSTEKTSKIIL
jgi:hypothetical protein